VGGVVGGKRRRPPQLSECHETHPTLFNLPVRLA
jgi:hypothetical protein